MKQISIGRLQKFVYYGIKRFLLLIKFYRGWTSWIRYVCLKSLVANIVGLDRLKDLGVGNVSYLSGCS
jgi:hypothetical protein